MKDNFSGHSPDYARYRPTYPDELYRFLYAQLNHYDTAWDCGTGNGQVATKLAEQFTHVYATDLSENQLAQAPTRPNITYRVERAEEASFEKQSLDLVTVAQAIHWFDFDAFYSVVQGALKPDGLLAILGYFMMTVDDAIDTVVLQLYEDILGDAYWDPERKLIEQRYQTIPFPFADVEVPAFTQSLTWSFDDLVGYLNTWSAVKHYEKRNSKNPISLIIGDLRDAWGTAAEREVHFPILLRVGTRANGHV